jgi:hypothetical protein
LEILRGATAQKAANNGRAFTFARTVTMPAALGFLEIGAGQTTVTIFPAWAPLDQPPGKQCSRWFVGSEALLPNVLRSPHRRVEGEFAQLLQVAPTQASPAGKPYGQRHHNDGATRPLALHGSG